LVVSAGLLVWRPGPLLLLVHPGGPFWAKKDEGAWSIPKGIVSDGEDLLAAARREFAEELGVAAPAGPASDLGSVKLRGGKVVQVFAVAGAPDVSVVRSNTFELEWPPRSGRVQAFPEVDRAEWFDPDAARVKLTAIGG
jgi:predicted NUDIX family NTP pyrophosphohydrolase